MSKDAALDKWIDAELPVASFNTRLAVCAAWHAAVKHTLALVAGELNKRANATAGPDCERVANVMCNLAVDIANMKP